MERNLADKAPCDTDQFPMEPGMTLMDIIGKLGLRDYEVLMALVNGELANHDTPIPDRAEVILRPIMSC